MPLTQHPHFAAALLRLGRRAEEREFGSAGRMIVVRRGPLTMTSRGPVWADPCPEARLEALRRHGPRLIEATVQDAPLLAKAGYLRLFTPASVALLPLCATSEAQLSLAKGKWRNCARRADRSSLRFHDAPFPPDPHHWLIRAEAAQRCARGYRALPPALALAWADIAPDAARLFFATRDRQPVAGMVMLLHPPGASYVLGWSGEAGRTASAHHGLLIRAACWLAERGIKELDLGTLNTEAAPGLARFKLGSGARPVALGGSWLRLRP